jgi:hypothetical protein
MTTEHLAHFAGCPDPDPRLWRGHNGDRMQTCKSCGFVTFAPVVPLEPEQPPTRYRLTCCRCERPIWLHRATPRVPLCSSCKRRPKPSRADRRLEEGLIW